MSGSFETFKDEARYKSPENISIEAGEMIRGFELSHDRARGIGAKVGSVY